MHFSGVGKGVESILTLPRCGSVQLTCDMALPGIALRRAVSLLSVGARKEYGLPDRQSPDASNRAVDTRIVLVRTNDGFQHFWRWSCCVGIKIDEQLARIGSVG